MLSLTLQAFSLSPRKVSPGLYPLKNPRSPSRQAPVRTGKAVWKAAPRGWGLGRILSSESPGPSFFHKGQTDTHAQKSSTVSNLVTSCRLSCQARLRSFLKNHRAHLEAESPCAHSSSTWRAEKSHPFKDRWGTIFGVQTLPPKVTRVSSPGGAEDQRRSRGSRH